MVDPDWLRNLASASYGGNGWQLADASKVERLKAARLKDALFELREEAQASIAIHNQFAPKHRAFTYLQSQARPPHSQGGLIVMLGSLQVSLELLVAHQNESLVGGLTATLSALHTDYTRQHKVIARYQAQTDTFGSLVWRRENSLLMTPELIIKTLLEELTKTAFVVDQNGARRG